MTDTHDTGNAANSLDGDTHEYTTDTQVRREVERAVEGVLDRWAIGDTAAETAIYVTKLRLTAAHLRH